MRRLLVLPGLLCATALVAAGCADEDRRADGSRSASRIDEVAGTFRGVGIGDSEDDIRAHLGPPPKLRPGERGRSGPIEKAGETNALGVAPPHDLPRNERVWDLRYPQVAFGLTRRTGAYVVDVSEPGATTTRGLRIGDSLDRVRDLYPDMVCGVKNESTEYEPFPYCSGRIAQERHIAINGDPVELITVTIRRMVGPDFGLE